VSSAPKTPPLAKGLYRHYKGNMYRLLDEARHSETLEECVVYEALYSNDLGQLWIRPKQMFTSFVEIDGKKIARFSFLEAQK